MRITDEVTLVGWMGLRLGGILKELEGDGEGCPEGHWEQDTVSQPFFLLPCGDKIMGLHFSYGGHCLAVCLFPLVFWYVRG